MILKTITKRCLALLGIDKRAFIQKVGERSIKTALNQRGLIVLVDKLRKIVPDISIQEVGLKDIFNGFWEIKYRGLHAFQCSLMLKAIEGLSLKKLTVVDVGDSAGTHMLYLRELSKGKYDIKSVSVNLDPCAIEEIKSKGLQAILCRAEDIDLYEKNAQIFVSFEMLEHLHNPALFLRRLAEKSKGKRMVITVPYLKKSRVGLHHIRKKDVRDVYAREAHVFELSPQDWTLLMLHSGWKVVYSKVYYQYPRHLPFFSRWLGMFWKQIDFEGFWGAILEKDSLYSNCYQDWDDSFSCRNKEEAYAE